MPIVGIGDGSQEFVSVGGADNPFAQIEGVEGGCGKGCPPPQLTKGSGVAS